MSHINELIAGLCPNGVKFKALGDILQYEQPGKYIVDSTDYTNVGIPVLTAGASFILGYTDETSGIYKADKNNPVIIFDDFTTSFHWVDFDFKVKSSAMKMLKPINNAVNFRFVLHAMRGIHYVPTEHSRQWIGTYSKFLIPLPPLEIQNRIVEFLDHFTNLTANLTAELDLRRKQFFHYREKLLSLDGVNGVEKGVLMDMLKQPITDGPHETPSFVDDGIPFISAEAVVNNKIDFSKIRGYISKEYNDICCKKYKPQRNDVYVVKSGSTVGKIAMVDFDTKFNIWSPLAALRVNDKNTPRYLFYLLSSDNIQDQIQLKSSKGSQPNLSMRVLEGFDVSIPPLAAQQSIVEKLDKFTALIENIERELDLRQKQYEYYREQLLSFN